MYPVEMSITCVIDIYTGMSGAAMSDHQVLRGVYRPIQPSRILMHSLYVPRTDTHVAIHLDLLTDCEHYRSKTA